MNRSGIRVSSAVVALVAAAIVLAGCASGGGSPTASPTASESPTSSASASPSTAPTPTPSTVVNLPTDCTDLGTPETWQATVGDMTLQSDGEGFVRPAPEGATLELGCDWIVGDATGVLLLISTATPEAVTAAVADLPAQGYTCQVSDDFGADFCTLPGSSTDTEEMIVAREGVWIYMSTSNRNGRALLSEIVQSIFA